MKRYIATSRDGEGLRRHGMVSCIAGLARRMTVAAACAAVAAMVLTGCSGLERRDGETSTEGPGPTATANQAQGDGPVVLEDGRHPVFVTKVDVPGRRLTFDLIQFFYGAEAQAEWDRQHPDAPEGPSNNYMIINNNPRLRTLPVSKDVAIKTLDVDSAHTVGVVPITFGDLGSVLLKYGASPMFWITIKAGEITLIEEQYLP